MESARDLLSRQLPQLVKCRGTVHASLSDEKLAAEYMFPWSDFSDRVLNVLGSLDLDIQVSLTDPPEGEKYVVGNELGLTARIIHNICDPVAKALSVTSLSGLRFCDIQALTSSNLISDVVLGILASSEIPEQQPPKAIAAGEVKPFWIVYLEDFPITSPLDRRRGLEPHMGKYNVYSFIKRNLDDHLLPYWPACILHARAWPEVRVLDHLRDDCLRQES